MKKVSDMIRELEESGENHNQFLCLRNKYTPKMIKYKSSSHRSVMATTRRVIIEQ